MKQGLTFAGTKGSRECLKFRRGMSRWGLGPSCACQMANGVRPDPIEEVRHFAPETVESSFDKAFTEHCPISYCWSFEGRGIIRRRHLLWDEIGCWLPVSLFIHVEFLHTLPLFDCGGARARLSPAFTLNLGVQGVQYFKRSVTLSSLVPLPCRYRLQRHPHPGSRPASPPLHSAAMCVTPPK